MQATVFLRDIFKEKEENSTLPVDHTSLKVLWTSTPLISHISMPGYSKDKMLKYDSIDRLIFCKEKALLGWALGGTFRGWAFCEEDFQKI